jgi:hypothetical protein
VIGQRSMARSQLGIMAGFQKVTYSICSILSIFLFAGDSEITFAQDPAQSFAGSAIPSATNANPNDAMVNQKLVSTFYDPTTGQQYGRYIIYETVPIATYQQQEVIEKQWVPEWVTENKLTTQTNYTPIVTYQLQLQNSWNVNPFATSQPQWQYVPVVQYQANNIQVSQPITYQKYVEKEFRKIIPVLKTEQQSRPKYADRPINPNGTMVASNPNFPSRPLNTNPTQPFVQPAPPAYYANNTAANGMSAANLASVPAYSPNGFKPTNYMQPTTSSNSSGWVAQNSVPNYTPPSTQFVNSPYPNAGVANYSYPNPYTNSVAARPAFQLPSFFSQTGALFPGGAGMANGSVNLSGTNTYVASNSMASADTWAGSTNWITNPPLYSGNDGSDITFRPTTPTTNYTTPPNYWNMTPVNDYRDPSQTGIPPSVLR